MRLRFAVLGAAAGLFLLAAPTFATTLTFSDAVSIQPPGCGEIGEDPCITADMLDATLDIQVVGSTLTLTMTNDTAGFTFDINQLYWSASTAVTGLTFVSAIHSDGTAGPGADGDVTADWTFASSTGDGGPTHGDGFGVHDFSVKDGVGTSTSMIGPTESVVFTFTIGGTGPFTMDDFVVSSLQTPSGGNTLTFAAAKFVNAMPGFGGNDSGFGAVVVPEPATAALVGLGLAGLGYAGRRRNR